MKNHISCLLFTIFLSFNTSLSSDVSDIKDEKDKTKNLSRSPIRTIPPLPDYLSSEQKEIFLSLHTGFLKIKESEDYWETLHKKEIEEEKEEKTKRRSKLFPDKMRTGREITGILNVNWR